MNDKTGARGCLAISKSLLRCLKLISLFFACGGHE